MMTYKHLTSVIKQLTWALALNAIFALSIANAQNDNKYQITKDDYNNQNVEMADAMRSDGKIYVVVSVMMIIFAGLTFYMYRTDKKVSALEKEINNEA